jgi:hypothetical protein
MDLPQPPDWREAAKAESIAAWVAQHFVTVAIGLDIPVTACTICASLVVPGEQSRHWTALHSPMRGGL